MNAAEIEDEISRLSEAPFDAKSFPYQFLQAFGVNDAALAKLKAGRDNKSDVPGGVLQRAKNNIHIKTCPTGQVADTLAELRQSPATAKLKAKYILATDGQTIAAERLRDSETLACDYKDLPNHFGILLDLAGISTTPKIDENTFDIRATNKLNKLYVELLRHNPDWGTEARRQDLNHFFARLIFCFFAEDTNIFTGGRLFTETVEKYTDRTGANVHEILAELFSAMDTRLEDRAPGGKRADLRPFALKFPYVNGNLFGGTTDTPRFTQAARIYLLAVGNLDWKQINPDIFGSMIQAVADDEERGALGMHYTSVPNILKVLNPLFLDDLRAKLEEAGDGKTPGGARKLLNLRNRLARIRMFDPACGSGNFLVIAYKEMRTIEAIINERRGERDLKSAIPISNFRGIELRSFPAEIARLALIIAEFQCDVLYRGELHAFQDFLPLDTVNWIACGNALQINWLALWPPEQTGVKVTGDDLFNTPLVQAEIDFENVGGETYICGNPPYVGDKFQTPSQKEDLRELSGGRKSSKAIDYITGWFWKASDYIQIEGSFAFVSTNSICQGVQVPIIWPEIFRKGQEIRFAHKDFYWSNNASRNANVICIVVGVSKKSKVQKYIFWDDQRKAAGNINAYLVDGPDVIVQKHAEQISRLPQMHAGNIPRDEGHLMLKEIEKEALLRAYPEARVLIRRIAGSVETINGLVRHCFWIPDEHTALARSIPSVGERLDQIRRYRQNGSDRGKLGIDTPHRFERTITGTVNQIVVPRVSSAHREYLPVAFTDCKTIVSDAAQAIYDPPLYVFAIIASRTHIAWIRVTAGRMKSDFRYSSGVCYNSFPVPALTDQNKAHLTRCAEDILLAREAHFPATIAEMYDPKRMDKEFPDLRAAHERNDETLERIYIGRRFRNDTERLEKLFAMYTEMTAKTEKGPKRPRKPKSGGSAGAPKNGLNDPELL